MNSEGSGVKSAQRALEILDLLTHEERALSFQEIADLLGYPRSSLHGLLRTLVGRSWLELDPGSRRYSLGIRTWEAGHAYLRARDLADRARPFMERVRDATDETVQMSVLDGRHNVYVAKSVGTQRLVLASEIGRRLEAHATGLGKVLLAGLETYELERRLAGVKLERMTPNTVTDRAALKEELRRVRERGYATDNGEYTVGVRCVAVPIVDHSERVIAALSVSIPNVRFSAGWQQKTLAELEAAAADLSAALGYRRQEGTAAGK
jgi:DNA-binding IclR family transcriptional regulator